MECIGDVFNYVMRLSVSFKCNADIKGQLK